MCGCMRDIERMFAPLLGVCDGGAVGASGRGGEGTKGGEVKGLRGAAAWLRYASARASLSHNNTAHLSPLDMTIALKYGSTWWRPISAISFACS